MHPIPSKNFPISYNSASTVFGLSLHPRLVILHITQTANNWPLHSLLPPPHVHTPSSCANIAFPFLLSSRVFIIQHTSTVLYTYSIGVSNTQPPPHIIHAFAFKISFAFCTHLQTSYVPLYLNSFWIPPLYSTLFRPVLSFILCTDLCQSFSPLSSIPFMFTTYCIPPLLSIYSSSVTACISLCPTCI